MPSLREVQERFAASMLDAAKPIDPDIAAGRFPPERLLQVYRNNVFASLTDALAAIYPVVQRLVGEGFFGYAADAFIHRHPPVRGNLHEFGGSFAPFLESFDPARALAYLPDMARLEWGWHEAFHAADAGAFSLADLAAVPPADYVALRFSLHPSVRLLESPWPILRIWESNQDGANSDTAINLDEGGARLLIRRRGLEVTIEPLGAGDFALLAGLRDGLALAAAADAALAAEAGYDLPGRLRFHVSNATVSGFTPM